MALLSNEKKRIYIGTYCLTHGPKLKMSKTGLRLLVLSCVVHYMSTSFICVVIKNRSIGFWFLLL